MLGKRSRCSFCIIFRTTARQRWRNYEVTLMQIVSDRPKVVAECKSRFRSVAKYVTRFSKTISLLHFSIHFTSLLAMLFLYTYTHTRARKLLLG